MPDSDRIGSATGDSIKGATPEPAAAAILRPCSGFATAPLVVALSILCIYRVACVHVGTLRNISPSSLYAGLTPRRSQFFLSSHLPCGVRRAPRSFRPLRRALQLCTLVHQRTMATNSSSGGESLVKMECVLPRPPVTARHATADHDSRGCTGAPFHLAVPADSY